MIEFLTNVSDKYSNYYKRSENDFTNGTTINQMIKRVNNTIKAVNKQTQNEIDRANRKYDDPEEMYIINKMKKRDEFLKHQIFKIHFKKK